ncbi:hypothetical protein HDU98_006335 [Podochytrium sp. JEL0797]|nr:hypothetical protein HDU98_006335 [Podochytrium sp. JEL0797]
MNPASTTSSDDLNTLRNRIAHLEHANALPTQKADTLQAENHALRSTHPACQQSSTSSSTSSTPEPHTGRIPSRRLNLPCDSHSEDESSDESLMEVVVDLSNDSEDELDEEEGELVESGEDSSEDSTHKGGFGSQRNIHEWFQGGGPTSTCISRTFGISTIGRDKP